MVNAENAYGNIAPTNNIAKMIGSSILAPFENGNTPSSFLNVYTLVK